MATQGGEDLYAAVRSEFESAEDAIARAQALGVDAVVSAVNELRYAGHHLAKAGSLPDGLDRVTQLRKAQAHARRALSDAVEAVAFKLLDDVSTFQRDYSHVDLENIVEFYSATVATARTLQGQILARNLTDDGEVHKSWMREFRATTEQLADLVSQLNLARPILDKHFARTRRRERRGLVAAIVGSVMSLVAGLTLHLQPILRDAQQTTSDIDSQISRLGDIQHSLSTLTQYVTVQQGKLESLRSTIGSLKGEEARLNEIVAIRKEAVDAILAQSRESARRSKIGENIVSFALGVSSSFVVSLGFAMWSGRQARKQIGAATAAAVPGGSASRRPIRPPPV